MIRLMIADGIEQGLGPVSGAQADDYTIGSAPPQRGSAVSGTGLFEMGQSCYACQIRQPLLPFKRASRPGVQNVCGVPIQILLGDISSLSCG